MKKIINNKKGALKVNFALNDRVILMPGSNDVEKEDYAKLVKSDYFKALVKTGIVKVIGKEVAEPDLEKKKTEDTESEKTEKKKSKNKNKEKDSE